MESWKQQDLETGEKNQSIKPRGMPTNSKKEKEDNSDKENRQVGKPRFLLKISKVKWRVSR